MLILVTGGSFMVWPRLMISVDSGYIDTVGIRKVSVYPDDAHIWYKYLVFDYNQDIEMVSLYSTIKHIIRACANEMLISINLLLSFAANKVLEWGYFFIPRYSHVTVVMGSKGLVLNSKAGNIVNAIAVLHNYANEDVRKAYYCAAVAEILFCCCCCVMVGGESAATFSFSLPVANENCS